MIHRRDAKSAEESLGILAWHGRLACAFVYELHGRGARATMGLLSVADRGMGYQPMISTNTQNPRAGSPCHWLGGSALADQRGCAGKRGRDARATFLR